jgi:hypothetical protein
MRTLLVLAVVAGIVGAAIIAACWPPKISRPVAELIEPAADEPPVLGGETARRHADPDIEARFWHNRDRE